METFYQCMILLSLCLFVATSDSASLAGNLTSSGRAQSQNGNGMAFSIDLRLCQCLELSAECELVIAKSNLLEIDCPQAHQFCCIARQSPQNGKAAEQNPSDLNNAEAVKSNPGHALSSASISPNVKAETGNKATAVNQVRMRISTVDELSTENESASEIPHETHEEKPRIKCRCKPRLNCSDAYVDYSFGFHCSYDKVRCCEPYELYLKEMEQQHGGRLLILEDPALLRGLVGASVEDSKGPIVNSFENNDEEEYINNCLCVPAAQCSTKNTNEISKRRDMACPFDYMQCCGSSIIVNKSDYLAVDKSYNEDIIPSEGHYIEGRGMASNLIQGQSSSRQKPVTLPELVIPTESAQLGRSSVTSDQTPAIASSPSTLAPPVLPNRYNPNQDKRTENGQAYYHQSVRRPIQQTQPYFTGRVVEIHNHLQPGESNKILPVGGTKETSQGRRLLPDDSIFTSIVNFFG